MLSVKQIQTALKNSKVTLNQSQINSLLVELKIDIAQCDEGHLEQIVEAIKGKAGTNGGLAVANSGRSKATLAVPEIPVVNDLDDVDVSANRQQGHTDIYVQKMEDTADQISDRNVEMVKALPKLVEVKTIQKLQAASGEIADLWSDVNETLTTVMFGL